MDFLRTFLTNLKVELLDEFDRNFERKAFFDKKWKEANYPIGRGSLLNRSGSLRRSLRASISGKSINFSSSLPYATIHNEGGTVTVTAKMKSFFSAMYYKASGAMQVNERTGKIRQSCELLANCTFENETTTFIFMLKRCWLL